MSSGVRRRRFVRFGSIAVGIIVVVVGVFLLAKPWGQAPTRHAAAPAPVDTIKAHTGDIDVVLEALGTVTPVSTVRVTSRVQGQIMQVHYREGQLVRRGDPLVDLDSRPYDADLRQAKGKLAHDQAALKQAKSDLKRYRAAVKTHAIARQQVTDQEQLVLQNEGNVLTDEGAVEAAQVNLDFCHIVAPTDGRVGLRPLDAGNMVPGTGTQTLAVVTQMRPIDVVFSIAQNQLTQVEEQVRQGGAPRAEIYDQTQETRLATGALLAIDNVIDTTTGTVRLKAEAANDDYRLFPDQFVNVRLLVRTEKNQTLVATSAIQRNAQGAFVYVVTPQRTATMQPIKTGISNAAETAVEGIKPGATVVVQGFERLHDGAPVEARQPAEPEGAPGEAHH